MIQKFIYTCFLLCLFTSGQAKVLTDTISPINALSIVDIGKTYERNPVRVPHFLFHAISNTGGTTSVRRNDAEHLKWKTQGYYQRNRELGQIFNIPSDTSLELDAIVLRTGNSSSAVLAGAPGAEVQIQLFEVLGSPVINNNNTPPGTDAEHGFTTNHRADDYLEGITYKTIALVRGGIFPDIPPTTQNGGEPGHLRYMRWDLEGSAEIKLEGGKRYAFMIGFVEDGPDRGFSLGNSNMASSPEGPVLRTDANGLAWWSMRREGDGTLPPTQIPGDLPPVDETVRQQLINESLNPPDHECKVLPATDGFPDVDTYRTMEFYIEVKTNCPEAGTSCDDGDPTTLNDQENGDCNCIGKTIFSTGLEVKAIGKAYERDPAKTPDYLFFKGADLGGSTSVRRVDADNLSWKDEGYFQRNRDLGQTFYVPADTNITLDAIILRTGNSSSAIKIGAWEAELYLQIFEVEGEPLINDNGTPPGTESTHGFNTNHRTDDFLDGISYKSLLVADGATFPVIGPTIQDGGQLGHLHYFRWDLLGDNEITLEGGKRYAFMVGFKSPAPERRFTLANVNRASDTAPPALLLDANGKAWWSMRREGDGTLPPTQYPGTFPPTDPVILNQLLKESLFGPAHQYELSPTTDGFPDVDTYRTLEFYIELKPNPVGSWKPVPVEPFFTVYPNPASSEFTVKISHQGPITNSSLQMIDAQGKVLLSKEILLHPGDNLIRLDSDLREVQGLLEIVMVKGDLLSSRRVFKF